MKHKVIGIDLGTTYSAVAAYDDTEMTAVIIGDERGALTTPSVIGLDPISGKVIVGEVAKRNAPVNPNNTIIEIKREMGELFTDALLDKYGARHDPTRRFSVGDPVEVRLNGTWRRPQAISAFTLMRMAAIAQRELGEEIRDAVVTVPAYFTANQKKATEEAALLAGLYPRQLIPEPTAAAICYGVDASDPEPHVYLVYDLGGGTFDVSIIKVREGAVDVVATAGDPRLGGGDFDDAIVHWAMGEAKQQGLDISNQPAARAMLKLAAEETKILLSTASSAKIVVADPLTGRSVTLTLDRATFEKLIESALQRSLSSVALALQFAADKSVPREAVDAVLLVGGSTKVPHVRQLLLDHFNRDESFVRADGNPDHLVARGAAMLAKRFSPAPPPFDIRRKPDPGHLVAAGAVGDVTLITEYSLGVAARDERDVKFDALINRGTVIPVSAMKTYTNGEGASEIKAQIYQGESPNLQEDTLIGEVVIGPIQPLPAGHHQFEVTFSLDRNGLLTVKVNHVNEGKSYVGDFKHKTTLGGDEALMRLREELAPLFQAVPVSAPAIIPPPPPPPPETVAPPASTAAAAPAAAEENPIVPAEGLPAGLLIELSRDVGDEFRSVIRRTRKQLLRRVDDDLVTAYNQFAKAANDGAAADELRDLADVLEDAYTDARHAS